MPGGQIGYSFKETLIEGNVPVPNLMLGFVLDFFFLSVSNMSFYATEILNNHINPGPRYLNLGENIELIQA